MRRHETHQIDEKAQQVFREAIPTTWVYNEQKNDYGKDYLVEIGEDDGELTGQNFLVQLKGKKNVPLSRATPFVKFDLETVHAAYYVKITDLPVFLVVVDVTQRRAWYLFLQPILSRNKADWQNKGHCRVGIPLANDLKNTAQFRAAVEDAKKCLRLTHPLAVPEAVQAHKHLLQSRDPRVNVDVSFLNNEMVYKLSPKVPIPLLIKFIGTQSEAHKRFLDLFVFGKRVKVAPGQLAIAGTPLLEAVGKISGEIQFGNAEPGAANTTMICKGGKGEELARIDIPGNLRRTNISRSFDGELDDWLLKVSFGPIQTGKIIVRSPLDLRRWNGQRLLNLPYFDKISALCNVLPDTVTREFVCHHLGNYVCTVTVGMPGAEDQEAVQAGQSVVSLLDKARPIARKMRVNPVWSSETIEENMQSLSILYPLLFEGGYVVPAPDLSHTVTWEKTEVSQHEMRWEGSVSFGEHGLFMFFGEEINVGDITIAYDNVSVNVQESKEGDDVVDIVIQGNEETKFCIFLGDGPGVDDPKTNQ